MTAAAQRPRMTAMAPSVRPRANCADRAHEGVVAALTPSTRREEAGLLGMPNWAAVSVAGSAATNVAAVRTRGTTAQATLCNRRPCGTARVSGTNAIAHGLDSVAS